MKRVITAFALLGVVVALSCGGLWLQSSSTDRLVADCRQLMRTWESGDRQICVQEAQNFITRFDEHTRWFPFFLRHTQIETLRQQVEALPLLLGGDDESAFPAELARIRCQIELLMDAERITPENIL